MNAWAAKRFWTDVAVVKEGGGFAIRLDDRPVKTPSKAAMLVPSEEMAQAVADEWAAVEGPVDPNVMPFTRSVNAAIDKVSVQFDEVAAMLAAYGGSDLLCYRADGPEGLIARQAEGWDPLLDWAADTFDAPLVQTTGIMPVTQDASAVSNLGKPLFASTPFQLTGLHDLVAMSGSLVLALGVTQRRVTPANAWELSRIDEIWQAEQWGIDDEAVQSAEVKRQAFLHAANFYFLT